VIALSILTGTEDTRTDEELVELALAGRGDSFARIYERYYSRAYRLAYAMTGQKAAAEDLAQEMFIRAWRKIAQFRGESTFATWFYRLAVNCSLNYRKREKRHQFEDGERIESLPQTVAARQMEAKILQKQVQAEVHRALLSLKPRLRIIVVLKDIEGLSYEEIADRVNCSTGTIASRLNRARNLLAQKLRHLKGNF
jgi:RNA polymerase sigma-70 factor (ECF subfamily)